MRNWADHCSSKLGTRYHIPLRFHDTVISNLSNNLAYVSAWLYVDSTLKTYECKQGTLQRFMKTTHNTKDTLQWCLQVPLFIPRYQRCSHLQGSVFHEQVQDLQVHPQNQQKNLGLKTNHLSPCWHQLEAYGSLSQSVMGRTDDPRHWRGSLWHIDAFHPNSIESFGALLSTSFPEHPPIMLFLCLGVLQKQWKPTKNILCKLKKKTLTWISGTVDCQTSPSLSSTQTSPPLRISPPIHSWPVRTGLAGSSMLYCLTSPCSQLEKYRKRSSSEMRKSVIRPGIWGNIQFCTFKAGTDIATWPIDWHHKSYYPIVKIEEICKPRPILIPCLH